MLNLQVELTNICNLDCIYCPRHVMIRSPKKMDIELFSKIYKTFENDISGVILNKDGDPFINNDLYNILKSIKPHHKIKMPTNGVLIPTDFGQFIDNLPNQVKLVITEHTYGRFNQRPLVLEKTRSNILNLLDNKPKNLSITVLKHFIPDVVEDVEEFKKFYSKLKGRYDFNLKINDKIDGWCDFINFPSIVKPKKCTYSHGNVLTFGVTGNLLLCCTDLNEECVIGNINNVSKKELLEKRKLIFNNINKGNWSTLSPCNRCISK